MFKDSDFRWYTPESARFMAGDYLERGDTLAGRFQVILDTACEILGPKAPREFRELFTHGVQQGWCSLSTPIWVNFGTDRGLPASCFNSHLEDSMESLMGDAHGEISIMSKNGGGTSVCFTPVRGRGAPIKNGRNGTSMGSVHFATHYQSLIRTSSQGSARRGSLAGYWHIRHPDILEVLKIKTEGHPIQDKGFHFGVVIDDAWMEEMLAGDKAKQEIWVTVLNARREHGEPYLMFEDTMNRGRPAWHQQEQYYIHSNNLCTETAPTSNALESFVCFLMSQNARYYDAWKGTNFGQMVVYFMDAVIEDFLRKARGVRYLERAVRYTERHRSMGIGVFGYHDLLQQRMLPFDSPGAFRLNAELFKHVRDNTVEASRRMAAEYGEPEVTQGYGQRHALLQAVAPTKSSAFIIEQSSEGIELRQANVVVEDKAKGKFEWWNPYLMKLLADRGQDTPAVRKQLLVAGGSAQGLGCLSAHEKAVFRTAFEVPQMAVVKQAAQRQQFIDQAQSVNVFLDKRTDPKAVHALYVEGWRSGMKTFYYQHGENDAKEFARDILSCSACEA